MRLHNLSPFQFRKSLRALERSPAAIADSALELRMCLMKERGRGVFLRLWIEVTVKK